MTPPVVDVSNEPELEPVDSGRSIIVDAEVVDEVITVEIPVVPLDSSDGSTSV